MISIHRSITPPVTLSLAHSTPSCVLCRTKLRWRLAALPCFALLCFALLSSFVLFGIEKNEKPRARAARETMIYNPSQPEPPLFIRQNPTPLTGTETRTPGRARSSEPVGAVGQGVFEKHVQHVVPDVRLQVPAAVDQGLTRSSPCQTVCS